MARILTGIPVIDDQHRAFVARAAAFAGEMRAGRGPQAAGELLRFLRSFTVTHFAAEEALMRERRYPGLSGPLLEHQHLQAAVEALSAELAASGATPTLCIELSDLVLVWFYEHTAGLDVAMGAWCAEHDRAARRPEIWVPRGGRLVRE